MPMSIIGAMPVLITPPHVGTPTSFPRRSVLIACEKISALLPLF